MQWRVAVNQAGSRWETLPLAQDGDVFRLDDWRQVTLRLGKGDDRWVTMLRDAIDYECLFRYGYTTKPLAPPLSDANWNSCGGSLTSVCNPHIHPMGIRVSGDFQYYAEMASDATVHNRWEDGIAWALSSLMLYPEPAGIGPFGITSERYCPSDGLLIERHTSNQASSIWYACHCFGVASMLEGLVDAATVHAAKQGSHVSQARCHQGRTSVLNTQRDVPDAGGYSLP